MSKGKKPFSGLFEVVDQQCNGDQIHAFLKRHKDINEANRKEILIGGNKPELIAQLQRHYSTGLIPKIDVYNLVRDCEESGQQHIFFFRPRKKSLSNLVNDWTLVAEKLFDENWGESRFPCFERNVNDYSWADFRRTERGWIAKIYGHETVPKLIGSQTTEPDDTGRFTVTKQYETEQHSTVLLASWDRTCNLLEIRIDSVGNTSKSIIPTRMNVLWSHLTPAIAYDDFSVENHRIAITKMMSERLKNSEKYVFGGCGLKDPKNGDIRFTPDDSNDGENIDSLACRSNSVNAILRDERSSVYRAELFWLGCHLICQDFPKEGKLRTTITGEDASELIITSKVPKTILSHVTNQLRNYSK